MKVETDIIASITAGPIERAGMIIIMYVEKTNIVFISSIILCLTSH